MRLLVPFAKFYKKISFNHTQNSTYQIRRAMENSCQCPTQKKYTWIPDKYITSERLSENNYALLILNRSIGLKPSFVIDLWNKASYRLTVDGGTDRWIEFMNVYCKNVEMKNPDMVTGDFDSVRKETMEIMKNTKCAIIRTPDQNETDFTKALKELTVPIINKQIGSVIALSESSGRLDQILANINTLFKADKFLPEAFIYLMSSNSLSWLLKPGHHYIHVPDKILNAKMWCALIPIGEKCLTTTHGLKWNLNKQYLQFGGIVSTSNTYNRETNIIEIDTNGYLLWSMGIIT